MNPVLTRKVRAIGVAALVVGLGDVFLMALDPTPDIHIAVGLLTFILQWVLTVLSGGLVGVALAAASQKNSTLAAVLKHVLRVGHWLPVIALWGTSFVSSVGILGVAAAAAYYSLMINSFTCMQGNPARKSLLIAEVMLHGLFIVLLVHVLEPSGFAWFAVIEPYGDLRAAAMIVFVLMVVSAVSLTTNFSFASSAALHTAIFKQVPSVNHGIWLRFITASSMALCLFVWQVFSELSLSVSSPWAIMKAGVSLVISKPEFRADIETTLIEICVGLALSIGFAVCVCRFMTKHATITNYISKLLPFTYATPLLVIPYLVKHQLLEQYGVAVLSVVLLAFFPALRILWGLKSTPSRHRALAALSDALPYAFLGALFAETMKSTAGLGFLMVTARSSGENGSSERAAILVIVLFLTVMSFVLKKLGNARTLRQR